MCFSVSWVVRVVRGCGCRRAACHSGQDVNFAAFLEDLQQEGVVKSPVWQREELGVASEFLQRLRQYADLAQDVSLAASTVWSVHGHAQAALPQSPESRESGLARAADIHVGLFADWMGRGQRCLAEAFTSRFAPLVKSTKEKEHAAFLPSVAALVEAWGKWCAGGGPPPSAETQTVLEKARGSLHENSVLRKLLEHFCKVLHSFSV